MRRLAPALFMWLASCAHAPPGDPEVLARTEEQAGKSEGGVPDDIEGRIFADEQRAADSIAGAVTASDPVLAGWAAVHTLRLGLKHDTGAVDAALVGGARSGEPLLEALSWRWLAVRDPGRIPRWRARRETDPVVECLAALALARRGKLPEALASVLGPPAGEPFGNDHGSESRERVEQLLGLTIALDAGPLALAVAFQEARRGEWVEIGPGGEKRWVAARLREELMDLVLGEDAGARRRVTRSSPVRRAGFTALSRSLESALLTRPPEMLRAAALTGPSALRVEALRALSTVVSEPTAADFGTAAAALDAEDAVVRLEGARAFLLFALRARKSAPSPEGAD